MRMDVYHRAEHEHKLSFLLVPAGKLLPEEVTNVDWVVHTRGVEVNEEAAELPDYGIDKPGPQIREKGYAITGVQHQVAEG
ncbi:MAG: hypothetical protein HYX47_21305 [Burkholderiales bacterium]|nr:hypothetical protein [Burkholderiales bacterium]